MRGVLSAVVSSLPEKGCVLCGECLVFVVRCVVGDVDVDPPHPLWVSIRANAVPTLSSKRYPNVRGLSDVKIAPQRLSLTLLAGLLLEHLSL